MALQFNDREDLGSILMRVIRTLSQSDSGEEREEEKRKLELQFRQSDSKVDLLVLQKQRELTQVMQTFSRVSNRLTSARSRVRSVREGLIACKELLHYKRDELKNLWLDGVEHRHVLRLLEQIEALKESPEKISSYLARKNFLDASRCLVQALGHLQGDLKKVEGLSEVKEVLVAKKESLYKVLLEDLSRQLFVESTWEVLQSRQAAGSFRDNFLHRSSSYRGSSGSKTFPGTDHSGRRSHSTPRRREKRPTEQLRARRVLLDNVISSSGQLPQIKMLTLAQEEEFQKMIDNPKLAESTGGPSHLVVIDIECLAMLNKLPDAVDALKSDLLFELQGIMSRTSQTLVECGPFPQGDTRLLPELFAAIVEQFYLVLDAFRLMVVAVPKSVERHHCDSVRLDLAEVWSRVQSVMQMLLTDYLDFKSKSAVPASPSASTHFSEPPADINSFFARRKVQRPKQESLFRFDSSSTALSMNDYLKEQSTYEDSGYKERSRCLVCPPNPHNITPIYPSLMEFIAVAEKALKCEPGSHCTLYAFLMDYIKDVFLGQIHVDNGNALNAASLSLDSWKAISDADVLRELQARRPLLQSTVGIKVNLDDLNRYMRTLPLYCEHFLTMICNVVMQYKDLCLAAFRGVVQSLNEDKRILSAQWANDVTVSRFLKSLPNWHAVSASEAGTESPQEVDQRNSKETAMLKARLFGVEVQDHEILLDASQLRPLALLQESLEWFCQKLSAMTQEFRNSNACAVGDLPKLSENSLQTLTSLLREFEELADTCLLVLHLEVRIHCFHYLGPIYRGPSGAHFAGGQDSTDPNAEVLKLTRDLLQVEEALCSSLQDKKTRYVFEGVSHLAAALLIAAADHIRKINTHGVKKMCRNIFQLQQTLTSNITGCREMALDMAKQYYELCNNKPQDILSGIVEKGPLFSKDEYAALLKLLHRSDPHLASNASSGPLQANLDKLAELLSQLGVAV